MAPVLMAPVLLGSLSELFSKLFSGLFRLCLALVFLLTACSTPGNRAATDVAQDFELGDVAKSDINMVVETHLGEVMHYLRLLMIKLYRQNPEERIKNGQPIEQTLQRVFGKQHNWKFPELSGKKGVDALFLAFHQEYQGDRVLAFVVGLGSMILASYNNKHTFFILDDLNVEKLHNSARNVEIAAWKLATTQNRRGKPLLKAEGANHADLSLSFERIFGKIIAVQDLMSKIAAQKTKRGVKQAIQFLIFLPL